MRWDERTRAYVERRSAEGKSKPEIILCLKRYICREVYRVLIASREGQDGPSSLPDGARTPDAVERRTNASSRPRRPKDSF